MKTILKFSETTLTAFVAKYKSLIEGLPNRVLFKVYASHRWYQQEGKLELFDINAEIECALLRTELV